MRADAGASRFSFLDLGAWHARTIAGDGTRDRPSASCAALRRRCVRCAAEGDRDASHLRYRLAIDRAWRRSNGRAHRRIEAAEAHLKSLGYREFRVRLHEGELARIEVPPRDWRDWSIRVCVGSGAPAQGTRLSLCDDRPGRISLRSLNTLIPLEIRNRNSLKSDGVVP